MGWGTTGVCQVCCPATYLVCLVVVLGVVLEDVWLLLVLEVVYELVGAELFSPFLVGCEPARA